MEIIKNRNNIDIISQKLDEKFFYMTYFLKKTK